MIFIVSDSRMGGFRVVFGSSQGELLSSLWQRHVFPNQIDSKLSKIDFRGATSLAEISRDHEFRLKGNPFVAFISQLPLWNSNTFRFLLFEGDDVKRPQVSFPIQSLVR